MPILSTMQGHAAVLTLDFADNHNALSTALVTEMLAALRSMDPSARVIVITAQGRFFSAGANIHDLKQERWLSGEANPADPVAMFEALATHRLPVIAAVTGPALGGGFELCLSCDLLVAADTSWFAMPEVGLGVVPNTAMARLTAIVGRRRALEVMMTRRRIPATEALALGLANQVVPVDEVMTAAIALARRITDDAPPGALAELKRGVDRHLCTDWAEVRASVGRLPEAEWREGLGAFVEKRKPAYEGFWNAAEGRAGAS